MASWLLPASRAYWDVLDLYFFQQAQTLLQGASLESLSLLAALNSPLEARFTPLPILVLHATALSTRGTARLLPIICCWLSLQIAAPLLNFIIQDLFAYHRDSPSYLLASGHSLQQIFGDSGIRDHSRVSFHSGHSYCLTFMLGMTYKLLPRFYTAVVALLALALSLPRLVSGGHWFTDVLFGALFAIATLSWLFHTPLLERQVQILQSLLKILRQRRLHMHLTSTVRMFKT